jgi:TfoX/Sxy family transcriptional regulator of competence genes
MVYDQTLADRAVAAVDELADITTRKMFGGFAIMWRGNMLVGVMGDGLMVRVGTDRYEELLAEPGAREMDFGGRSMRGMLYVAGSAVQSDEGLATWVQRCRDFAATLPAK